MQIFFENKTTILSDSQTSRYVIGANLLANFHKILKAAGKNYSGFLILADKNAFSLYGKKIFSSLKKLGKPIIVSQIVAGEQNKNIDKIADLVRPYFRMGFNRNACLISIGGGVVTDIGGFIASILLRGIDSIYVPTTLLAQADASVGGKTGVNFADGGILYKNMLGNFSQPNLVVCDVDTLRSLPARELISGLGEIVKYYVGWGKPDLSNLGHLRGVSDRTPLVKRQLAKIISICQTIKLEIVQQDPLETGGIRQKLNLGHTIGHAIEGASGGKLTHGEAVSIGIAAAARISLSMKLLKFAAFEKIIKAIASLRLPIQTTGIDKQLVLQALNFDKKGGTFVLIEDIGKLKSGVSVDPALIKKVLEEIIV